MAKQTFDIGIYHFHRTISGPHCKDDGKMKQGDVIGCLHPLYDHPVFAYGIHQQSKDSVQLVRQNLRFKKIITLTYTPDSNELEMHTKLNVMLNFLADPSKQLQIV